MCDSDSEEFASADEDFEEIEPDELEEVLGSVKPSDVSSKKSFANPSSVKSDVDVVSSPAADSTVLKESVGSSIEKNEPETVRTDTTTVHVDAAHQEKQSFEMKEKSKVEHKDSPEKEEPSLNEPADSTSNKESLPTLTKQDDLAKEVELLSIKTTNALPKPNNSKGSATADLQDEPSSNTNEDNSSTSSSFIPVNDKPYTSADTVKPKKLILKPARPQLLEQPPKKSITATMNEETVEPKREQSKPEATAQPEATTEEGWDDFDDDWGDFNVDASAGDAKQVQQKEVTANAREQRKTEQRTAKASFRDVDIDDVEHKLNDFMKHKDDPPLTSVFDRLASNEESSKTSSSGQSWGSWKPSWGGAAVSFLSTASKSVASITTNITQVIESGIGVPNPEEMARRQAEMEAKLKAEGYLREESDVSDPSVGSCTKPSEDRFGFDQLVSGVTQISSKVITGGLDTLEGIGKKTMTILQENDPGLLNKRKLLGLQPNDGVILSQVLREAKAKTEERERNLKQVQKHQYKKKLHFETLFDDYHGLVHLEALEMLSKQASLKLESLMAPLTGKALEELQETMSEVKELCELPDMDNDDADGRHTAGELDAKLKEAIIDLDPNVKVDFTEIVKSWTEYMAWIDDHHATSENDERRTAQDIFEKAMRALAQTTALCVLRMHKLAEILLISEHHSTATEADVVVQLTTVFCWHLSGVATRFCSELTKRKDESGDESDSALITNIFLEGSNSTSYIQNAFQLFIPILQLGAA